MMTVAPLATLKGTKMRKIQMTLATLAAVTLTAAPLAAQDSAPMDAANVTTVQSTECMMATLPFMMEAAVKNPDLLEEIGAAGEFWAMLADSKGEPDDAELAVFEAEADKMMADFEAVETDADMAAFLAPYQAKFDACEELRKALQAG